MRSKAALSVYAYSLTALTIAISFASALGFVLYSGLRHLVWIHMLGSRAEIPLYSLETSLAALGLVVFWYRLLTAFLRQLQQYRKLENNIQALWVPKVQGIPSELRRITDWYVIDDEERYAFTLGILRQKIIVSTGLWNALGDRARTAVLYHEAAHARMRDPLQQGVLAALTQALPWLRIRTLYDRYLIRRELLADTLAIEECDGDDTPLLEALIATVGYHSHSAPVVGLTDALQERIRFLETKRMPAWGDGPMRYRLISTVLAILVTALQGLLVWCH
jgi:Zn-dependent protease with chaperone function